jgi:hypothetical protein
VFRPVDFRGAAFADALEESVAGDGTAGEILGGHEDAPN